MYTIYQDTNNLWFLGNVGAEETVPTRSCKMKWKGTHVEIWTINGYKSELLYSGDVTSIVDGNQIAYPSKVDFLVRVKNFFVDAPAYGEIYGANNLVTSIIPTGTNWTKATPFNANGLTNDVIADHTQDQITIKIPGVYIVSAVFSTAIDVNNTTLDTAVFKNGNECPNLYGQRLIVNANFISVNGLSGIIRCNTGDVLDVRCKHNAAGNVILSTKHSCLSIKYIGG